ncbi:hypothetical protein [Pseudomonas lundensis]|uniref:hypothetical protein n=1 Tax=Pseudomonas lundensis TaxID=86185 RepID=UPI00089DD426|nr:hypothetical protein [Pseudomonas lundensis]
MPTIVIHGYARVKFRKTVSGVDPQEIQELMDSQENLECTIDLDDCINIESFESIQLTIKEPAKP